MLASIAVTAQYRGAPNIEHLASIGLPGALLHYA
jgi:hypothetical protein